MISSKTIEEVFEVAIIEDVISEFVVLKKSGANFKGLSPFSNEKTPSFMVSPSKRIWKDFSSSLVYIFYIFLYGVGRFMLI